MITKPISTKRPDWLLAVLVLLGIAILIAKGVTFNKLSKTQSETELLDPEQNLEPEQAHGKPLTAIWIPGKLLFQLSSSRRN